MNPSASSMGRESMQRSAVDQMETFELLTDALVQRFHVGAGLGASASSSAAVELTRRAVKDFLQKVLAAMVVFMDRDRRVDLRLIDVTRACRYYGIHIYGYDDTIVVRDDSGDDVFHVTELEEIRTALDKPDRLQSEPDLEPGACCALVLCTQTQEWSPDDVEEHDEDERDEWSWYDDSDAESSDDDDDIQENQRYKYFSSWQRTSRIKPVTFQSSFQRIPEFANEQSLMDAYKILEPEQEDLECDGPIRQDYGSEFDEIQLPANPFSSKAKGVEQPSAYHTTNSQSTEIEDVNLCVIPHQAFCEIFRGLLECTVKISSVALKALHSTTERYLTRSLTNGVLRHQLQTLIVEEAARELQDKLQLTLEKVNKARMQTRGKLWLMKSSPSVIVLCLCVVSRFSNRMTTLLWSAPELHVDQIRNHQVQHSTYQ